MELYSTESNNHADWIWISSSGSYLLRAPKFLSLFITLCYISCFGIVVYFLATSQNIETDTLLVIGLFSFVILLILSIIFFSIKTIIVKGNIVEVRHPFFSKFRDFDINLLECVGYFCYKHTQTARKAPSIDLYGIAFWHKNGNQFILRVNLTQRIVWRFIFISRLIGAEVPQELFSKLDTLGIPNFNQPGVRFFEIIDASPKKIAKKVFWKGDYYKQTFIDSL